ncbi:glycine/betaine ABC transporter substrate-binding protein, partial [Clavibacter lycopersici]
MPTLPRSARLRRALGVPALVAAGLATLTGCGLQPATAYVPD